MSMSGWDRSNVYSVNIVPNDRLDNIRTIKTKCDLFFENFRINNDFVYREKIRRSTNLSIFSVDVDLKHIYTFDETLAGSLQKDPFGVIELLELSAQNLAQKMCESEEEEKTIDVFQVLLLSPLLPITIRLLSSQKLGQIVRISGIVVSASTCLIKPTRIHAVCRSCMNRISVSSSSSFGKVVLPRTCQGSGTDTETRQIPCPLDPFVIVPEQSKFVDMQTIKIQETSDEMPPGELPCNITATINRTLVNTLAPGSRVMITGIYSVSETGQGNKTAVRQPYLHVIYIESKEKRRQTKNQVFSEEKEAMFQEMAKDSNLYERIFKSIAPSIYGNEDIKKAISCLLFGGSRKLLPDGIKIRGDINVLLLGDPGTAKSQFLKFAQKVAPVSVYTSGKGSSAAGLTASVIKDPRSGGFYLEGGAMVLADGGVVCIDEFDKMNEEDRVAIHEAMEQQTISIAKAGITTILNTRTSVLAAANPAFGRYDEMHTSEENIDFPTTILSRFDMIFIIKDEHSTLKDVTLAKHILAIHMGNSVEKIVEGEIDVEKLQEYIAYARTKCAPRISMGAAEKLSAHYVGLRKEVRGLESELQERSAIPITIRQLEAIIRTSEALAKMTLSPVATEEHVEEALYLFKVSTMAAIISGHTIDGIMRPEAIKEIERIERDIKKRISVGSSINYNSLIKDFSETNSYSETSVFKAIDIMVKQGKLSFQKQKNILIRQS